MSHAAVQYTMVVVQYMSKHRSILYTSVELPSTALLTRGWNAALNFTEATMASYSAAKGALLA